MGDERCAAYVLGSGCHPTRAAFATDVQRALDAGDSSARHRQFRCTHGDTLFFVRRSCNGAAAHFRHAPTGVPAGADGAVAAARGACGCSKTHIDAQALIQRHVFRLCVRTWRACGKHPAGIWRAADGVRVYLEQSAVFRGQRVRYDVAVYEAGRLAKVIEVRGGPRRSATPPPPPPRTEAAPSQVRHTSETRPEKRPANTIELRAEDVVRKLGSGDGPAFLDNLMTADEPCPECEARAAAAAAAAKEEQQRRLLALEAEKQREAAREAARAEAERQREAREAARVAEAARAAAAERARIAKLEAASAAFERQRAEAAARMTVKETPGCSRMIGTDVPEVSQEEIDRRRQERMARQAASHAGAKRGSGSKRRRTAMRRISKKRAHAG